MKGRRLKRVVTHDQLMNLMGHAAEWVDSGDVFDEVVGEAVMDVIDDLTRHTDASPSQILQEARRVGRGLQVRIAELYKAAGIKPPSGKL